MSLKGDALGIYQSQDGIKLDSRDSKEVQI